MSVLALVKMDKKKKKEQTQQMQVMRMLVDASCCHPSIVNPWA